MKIWTKRGVLLSGLLIVAVTLIHGDNKTLSLAHVLILHPIVIVCSLTMILWAAQYDVR